MKQITVQELEEKLLRLSSGIQRVVNATKFDVYNDWTCIKDYDSITDPDQLQLLDDYQRVVKYLCDIQYTLLYYQREIVGEGILTMNARGYFEDDYHEYHCEDVIEFYFFDDWDEKYKWKVSKIGHNKERYYIVGNSEIDLNGLRVRHRRR